MFHPRIYIKKLNFYFLLFDKQTLFIYIYRNPFNPYETILYYIFGLWLIIITLTSLAGMTPDWQMSQTLSLVSASSCSSVLDTLQTDGAGPEICHLITFITTLYLYLLIVILCGNCIHSPLYHWQHHLRVGVS